MLFRKKKGLFRSKNTVHLSLLSFFFVMDFLDSFLGPRTPLIPRSRFAPSNPLEYSDITKDFWLILVSWALITLCSRFKSTCKINSKSIEINLTMEKFVKWRKSLEVSIAISRKDSRCTIFCQKKITGNRNEWKTWES